ncbi:hypothetical protein Bca4012_018183 [Brassica carinata]
MAITKTSVSLFLLIALAISMFNCNVVVASGMCHQIAMLNVCQEGTNFVNVSMTVLWNMGIVMGGVFRTLMEDVVVTTNDKKRYFLILGDISDE